MLHRLSAFLPRGDPTGDSRKVCLRAHPLLAVLLRAIPHSACPPYGKRRKRRRMAGRRPTTSGSLAAWSRLGKTRLALSSKPNAICTGHRRCRWMGQHLIAAEGRPNGRGRADESIAKHTTRRGRTTPPRGPVRRCTYVSSGAQVATAWSTRKCSSCLIASHQATRARGRIRTDDLPLTNGRGE